jgi:hypothetical protein
MQSCAKKNIRWQGRAVIVATVVAAALAGVFASSGAIHAAPASTGSNQIANPIGKYTHTMTETVRLTTAQCASLRKVDAKASCILIHTAEVTDLAPSVTANGMAQSSSCPVTTKYFNDYFTEADGTFQLEITSAFSWSGNCGQPTGFNGPHCTVPWSFYPYSDQQCYYWHSGEFNATEAKQTVFLGISGVGFTAGQYRGCRPDTSCYWGWI